MYAAVPSRVIAHSLPNDVLMLHAHLFSTHSSLVNGQSFGIVLPPCIVYQDETIFGGKGDPDGITFPGDPVHPSS